MGVAFAVLALVACRDEMPDMQDPRANTDIYNWSQLFDCYWTGMNYNYVFGISTRRTGMPYMTNTSLGLTPWPTRASVIRR